MKHQEIVQDTIGYPQLYTIGYEGRTIDEYTEVLLENNIKIVVDVRRNPISRKKGFSKKALSETLNTSGIEYIHIPELGIESSLRKNLESMEDYVRLFQYYEDKLLPRASEAIGEVESILCSYGAIALTCFERNPKYCHRHCIAEAIMERESLQTSTIHL